MIRVRMEIDGKDYHMAYGRPVKSEKQYKQRVLGVSGFSQAISKTYGGYFKTQFSEISVLPSVFGNTSIPSGSYPVWVEWVKEEDSNDNIVLIFDGIAYFHSMSADKGAVFRLYAGDKYEEKIDLASDWASINNHSLVDVVTSLCGGGYLELTVNSTYARNPSPNVNLASLTGERLCIDLVTFLCESYNHCFRIENGVLHLIDMFTDVGEQITLSSNKIISGTYGTYTPVSKVEVSGEDSWEIVAGSYPAFGNPVSLEKFHDTEANCLTEMERIKKIYESNKIELSVPMLLLDTWPMLGQNVFGTDMRVQTPVYYSFKVRSVVLDWSREIVKLGGEGEFGVATVEDVVFAYPTLDTGGVVTWEDEDFVEFEDGDAAKWK